jgi:exonuclease VII large subunit
MSRFPTPTKTVRATLPNPNLPVEEQLQLERSAREQAEEKVASMTMELEELTQSLFEEANTMVRTEREKCARLEARLQIMESREEDKRRRLTELEKAIGRITKVRSLLENKNGTAVTFVG